MKTYRQVQCSDRLPDESNEWIVCVNDSGGLEILKRQKGAWCVDDNIEYHYNDIVMAWLEEIQLPTEEEIKQNIPYQGDCSKYQLAKNVGFINGARWILSKLK